jgi:hypothetical protein
VHHGRDGFRVFPRPLNSRVCLVCIQVDLLSAEGEQEVSAEETEAAVPSIAAHFSTPLEDISAVKILLCEGRGALASSMVAFRYMLDYGFIQFTAVMVLYTTDTDLSDVQFLWGEERWEEDDDDDDGQKLVNDDDADYAPSPGDLFNVLTLLLLLNYTPASSELHKGIPEADLMGSFGLGCLVHAALIVGAEVGGDDDDDDDDGEEEEEEDDDDAGDDDRSPNGLSSAGALLPDLDRTALVLRGTVPRGDYVDDDSGDDDDDDDDKCGDEVGADDNGVMVGGRCSST